MKKVVLDSSKKIVLKLSPKVDNQIRILCDNISDVEWSGTLFFKINKGSFDDKICELEAKEIYLQDIGSHSYTEYEFGADVVNFMMNNPELIDCNIAHVH